MSGFCPAYVSTLSGLQFGYCSPKHYITATILAKLMVRVRTNALIILIILIALLLIISVVVIFNRRIDNIETKQQTGDDNKGL
jgi:hypothetical protein